MAYAAAGDDGRGRAGPEQPVHEGAAVAPGDRAAAPPGTGAGAGGDNGAQRPHEYHSLVGGHYLTRTLATGASVTVSAAVYNEPALADLSRPAPREIDIRELHITALPGAGRRGRRRGADRAWCAVRGPSRGGAGLRGCPILVLESGRTRKAMHPGRLPFWLHVRHIIGRWVRQDEEEAIRWFRRTAEQDDTCEQNNLGVRCGDGLGVSRDYEDSVFWFRRAAEQGFAAGQNNLGRMYSTARGVSRDYEMAVLWYR